MFGIKIITEERYQSELNSARKLAEINEEIVQKNVGLELDIKSLREQNSRLRSVNAKRKEENDSLKERYGKLRKKNEILKGIIKEHNEFRRSIKLSLPEVDFKGSRPVPCSGRCSECSIEQPDCRKYTGLSLCMQAIVPSFREEPQQSKDTERYEPNTNCISQALSL